MSKAMAAGLQWLSVAVLLLLVPGCTPSPTGTSPSSLARTGLVFNVAANQDRSVYAYVRDDAVFAVRGMKMQRVELGGCLHRQPDKLFLSADGDRAFAFGTQGVGWPATVGLYTDLSCLIDFKQGVAKAIPDALKLLLDFDPGHRSDSAILSGPRTGFTYVIRSVPDRPSTIIDQGGQRARLPMAFDVEHCDLIETEEAIIAACAVYDRSWKSIELTRLNSHMFPPVVSSRRQIAVWPAEHVKLSRDGRLVASWGWQYPPGGEAAAILNIHETESGTRKLSKKKQAKLDESEYEIGIADVEFAPSGNEFLVVQQAHPESGLVFRFDERHELRQSWKFQQPPGSVFWLADGRSFVYTSRRGYARIVRTQSD
jgi:hypothetical protein